MNCAILGQSVGPDDEEFSIFIKEVAREMTSKAGQKCTAIRRVIVPEESIDAVIAALSERLSKVAQGYPALENVRLGALVSADQAADVRAKVEELCTEAEIVFGGDQDLPLVGLDSNPGAFYPATLLRCNSPMSAEKVHSVEAFGPSDGHALYQPG